jgi:hypothetical protein
MYMDKVLLHDDQYITARLRIQVMYRVIIFVGQPTKRIISYQGARKKTFAEARFSHREEGIWQPIR